jgi:hypothetical protein
VLRNFGNQGRQVGCAAKVGGGDSVALPAAVRRLWQHAGDKVIVKVRHQKHGHQHQQQDEKFNQPPVAF